MEGRPPRRPYRGRGGFRGRGGRGAGGEGRGGRGEGGDNVVEVAQRDPGAAGRGRRGDGGGRGGARPHSRTMHPIGYNALKDKLAVDPGDLLVELCSDRSPVRPHLVNPELHNQKPDFVDLLLGVLVRAIECRSSPQHRNQLFGFLTDSAFFTHAVPGKLLDKQFGAGNAAWPALANYLAIAEGMVTTVGGSWRVVHPVVLELLEQTKEWSDLIGWTMPADGQALLQRVIDGIKAARERQNREKVREVERARGVDTGPPPEDFRELSIFPSSEDLKVKKPYLRANKVDGAYDDCEHYLDVQFRLLREDFMCPLRAGVAKYLEQAKLKQAIGRLQDIKLYYGVVILGAVVSQRGLTYRIRFDTSKMRNIHRLMASKRLLYGALLCLSADNFETVFIATVQDKNAKDIVRGELEVTFEGPSSALIQAIDYSTLEFTMVETTAYFMAYRHILEGLKDLKPAELPFQRYIVKCSCAGDNPPAYLRQLMFTYDLTCIAPSEQPRSAMARLRQVLAQPGALWPKESDLGLDASQLAALRLALSNEFAVIQGPPGTGKTYIGLKIVRVLLENLTERNGLPSAMARLDPFANTQLATAAPHATSSPIMVVCYTNHALDQFLEGIYEYANGGIVRVGGRSSSEKMQQCTISKLRDHRQISAPLRRRYAEVRGEIATRRGNTMILAKRMAIPDKGILQFHVIESFIQENHAWQLRPTAAFDVTVDPEDLLKAWLGLAPLPDIVSGIEDNADLQPVDANPAPVNDEAGRPDAQQGAAEQNDDEESSDDDFIDAEENVFETGQRKLEDSDDEDLGTAVMALQQVEADEIGINFETLAAEQRAARARGADHPAAVAAAANAGGDGWTTVTRKTSPKQLLKKLRTTKPMVPEEEQAVGDIWRLKMDVRWRLYMTWVCRYRKSLSDMLVEESEGHDERVRELDALRMQGDVAILQKARVIGMTTTGAARYRHVLQAVRPRVIIVEEAAEVLEAHIVTTLSPSCEHLILIGDHKQLRPNPTVYELAKTYKLDMSLFERMVQNNLPYRTLSTQHRMRPEISYVMRHIYDNLIDHESVEQYESIQGMKHNMFYVSHMEHEEHDDVISSHSNRFEAKFVVALCRYLMQQGYRANQITVLTPYTGQLLLLRSLMRQKSDTSFEDVRVTSIDNYQGEENDIVLLSTVRSNNEGRVGFTNVSNRVCVALSRAKKGLYVLGNFAMLEKHSDLWRKIISDVVKSGKLGPKLPLICQSHGSETLVGCAEDFSKAIEGGCSLPCEARMTCGHSCDLMCHPFESAHDAERCQKPCRQRFAICGHACTRKCAEDCGNCKTLVMRVLACGHRQDLPCHVDPANHSCRAPCERRLRCGHLCGRRCGDACDNKCLQAVSRVYSCGHTNTVCCHQSEDEAPCKQACDAVLACMHPCKGTCGICHQGRLHKPCAEECKRPLVCGHLCEGRCCNGCPPCKKLCQNRCPHSSCRKACGEPCVPCKEPCRWQCSHYKCSRLCSEPCDRPPCDKPCPLRRTCKRCKNVAPCVGLCGEPCPLVCDRCDPTMPYRQLFFGDEDEADARFLQLQDCKHIIVSTAMDRWMRLSPDDDNAAASNSIGLKGCPRCKTPIRRCVRYGILVNAQLDDIEKVKVKIRGANEEAKARLGAIIEEATAAGLELEFIVSAAMRAIPASNNMEILEFQLKCLEKIQKLSSQCQADTLISDDLKKLKKFVLPLYDTLRQQEFNDVSSELLRLEYATLVASIQRNRSSSLSSYSSTSNQAVLRASQLLTGRFDDHKQKEMKLLEPTLRNLAGFISREEKDMIMKAMNFAQKGHWYKCPKGHIYCIGECGGATEESKCPECKCSIGGTSHRLRADNAVATEMDGATQPAFSEANNMLPLHFLN